MTRICAAIKAVYFPFGVYYQPQPAFTDTSQWNRTCVKLTTPLNGMKKTQRLQDGSPCVSSLKVNDMQESGEENTDVFPTPHHQNVGEHLSLISCPCDTDVVLTDRRVQRSSNFSCKAKRKIPDSEMSIWND